MSRLGRCQTAHVRRAALALGCLLLLGLLAGCSGSGNQLTPGLAGATQDHPAAPPKIAATGPGGAFAFVYDNQIWLRDAQGGAKQLTHLVLSNGATLAWGPLVWSQDGKYIAFSLVQNLTPSSPTRSTGPLYYVDVGSGNAYTTPGTGSIYGHTYSWFTDRGLIYSSTSDLMLYDLGDADPRVWGLRTAVTSASFDGTTFNSGGNSYGDIALSGDGNTLYYTVLNVTSLGGTGIVGSAEVRSISLYQLNSDFSSIAFDNPTLPTTIAQDVQQMQNNRSSQPVAPLGSVYSDATGTPTAGAWQLSSGNNGDSYIAAQQIDGVDTGKGIVTSHFCRIEVGGSYCNGLFPNVGKYPLGTHATLALSASDRVAVTTDALYSQGAYGGAVAKVTAASGWGVAPSWSGDGKHLLATQLDKTTTNAGGATRFDTDVVATDGGANSVTFIGGGMNAAWQP